MKTRISILACLLIACFLTACSMTPIQKVATAQTLYNDSLATAITLRQNRLISDSEATNLEILRANAYQAIQTAKLYATSGQTITFVAFEPQLNTILDKFLSLILTKTLPPTSQPSTGAP